MSNKGANKGSKKTSKQTKADVNAKQLSLLKRKRFIPVIIISLLFVFMLPTLVFMVIHLTSVSAYEGDIAETEPSGEPQPVIESTEVLTSSDTSDEETHEMASESLLDRYPELFPELFPEQFSELTQAERYSRPPDSPVEPGTAGVAYLTFDDGPSREITPGILDLLAEEGIRATFFVLPRSGVDDIYQRIIDEGHEVGNHSYSHNYRALYNRSIDEFKEDVIKAHEFILTNFDYTMTIFRFPGGSMSWNADGIMARADVIEELGLTHFDWHIDSGDAHPNQRDKSTQALTANVLNNTNGIRHVIVLMHDSGNKQTSLNALPAIIQGLRDQGYAFDVLGNYPGG